MLPGGGCKCDGRGGGLTAALLCGIWCAAMLITASHHPPSLRIYHCLMIYPPSLPPPYPSPICSPPLCLIYWVKLQHEAAAAAAAALLSVWSLIADSHHFCQSQFIILNISLPHSIHLSLSLHSFVVVFFFLTERKKWFAGETELTSGLMWIAASLRCRQSQFITSAPRLSFCVPSCLFSERRMWSENYLLLM